MYAILFPNLDPVAFEVLTLEVRWYSLAYIVGILLGYILLMRSLNRDSFQLTSDAKENIILYMTIGIIVGGRLGYILFYDLHSAIYQPIVIFKTWQGGMSFHGGLVGGGVASYVYARRYGIPFLQFVDALVCVVPIGIFLGRLANFVNQELCGRITDSPLGVIFPKMGSLPRHPSQLYEAALEGLILFVIMQLLFWRTDIKKYTGKLTGVFFCYYGVVRILVELLREPDQNIGYLAYGLTMGQILSIPMCIAGLSLIIFKRR
ncbi:prolipoprotein diacylglyceryl transferase [Rickettsiales endosymbiont of Peranema trichophorum]|uniref:prolipoprotein diacylglyceryl transferase n=1 Tax=Rickettsiales endosymbiont of Peranema trichophorum TaxID=2486577 RepID=UPI0010230713|nr:prolipoprotein diacylglyceryl transferase [Rickettsiales endosymbiont of Peranema trichophorum]RZI47613.1 prolipoprotein diacylglyceryl transferase [Rickettsiales endosymbiont of Peranema trichophorum]